MRHTALARSLMCIGLALTLAFAATACSAKQSPPAGTPSMKAPTNTPPITASNPATATTPGDKLEPFGTLSDGTKIVLLGWNDLGMHCYNPDFKDFAILPPYNNLHAQVVAIGGEDPRVITKGFTIEYSFPENTYSQGAPGKPDKTNFWTYVKEEFGADLQPDIGLKGKGLSGKMDVVGNQFVAEGIPITDVLDKDAGTSTIYPYQKARVVVRDSKGKGVAGLTVVAPVSTEMHCDTCHSDTGDATERTGIKPTGDIYQNILAAHDRRSAADYKRLGLKPLVGQGPLLCASCHSDNALGAKGKQGISSLSNAMHNHHSGLDDIPNTTEGCQNCHPGPNTKCLRDVHSQDPSLKYQCPDCHGSIEKVAKNSNPWLNEPRCDDPACHKKVKPAMIRQNDPLFRRSTGMGGIACEGCHDSTHAVAESREANDHIKFLALQGDATNLHKCAICHGSNNVEGNTKVHQPGD